MSESNTLDICYETLSNTLHCLTQPDTSFTQVQESFLQREGGKAFSFVLEDDLLSITSESLCLTVDIETDVTPFVNCTDPNQQVLLSETDEEGVYQIRDISQESCLTVVNASGEIVSDGESLFVSADVCFDSDDCLEDCENREQSQSFFISSVPELEATDSDDGGRRRGGNGVNNVVPYRPFDTLFEQIYQSLLLFIFVFIIVLVVWKYKLLPASVYDFFETKRRKRDDLLDGVVRSNDLSTKAENDRNNTKP